MLATAKLLIMTDDAREKKDKNTDKDKNEDMTIRMKIRKQENR